MRGGTLKSAIFRRPCCGLHSMCRNIRALTCGAHSRNMNLNIGSAPRFFRIIRAGYVDNFTVCLQFTNSLRLCPLSYYCRTLDHNLQWFSCVLPSCFLSSIFAKHGYVVFFLGVVKQLLKVFGDIVFYNNYYLYNKVNLSTFLWLICLKLDFYLALL